MVNVEKFAGSLRQAVKYATLSKDERLLREVGFLNENGTPTEQGRRIIADYQWESNKDLQKAVTAMVRKTLPKAKKGSDSDEE
jgi:hypothetical protein